MTNTPATYRTKVRLVQAIQYEGTVESAIACGLRESPISRRRYVDTADGRQWVVKDDWITTEELGIRRVLGPSAFHAQYEATEEAL